jgi:DNA polymerase III delta subunit
LKFQNVTAFEKHLHSSSLVSSYLIATSDGDERLTLASNTVSMLMKKHPGSEVIAFSAQQHAFSVVVESLSTHPLFSSHVIVRLDDANLYNKKEREILESLVIKPSGFAFLVMSSSSLKEFSSLCTSAKNDLVILDLTAEKPWDKQRRLQQWVVERGLKEGKKVSMQVALELMDACGPDMMLLEKELLKLSTYVGERPLITSDDVKKIGVNYILPTGWQMAEALVFEGKAPVEDAAFDLSDLLPLLGQVRYHWTMLRQVSYYLSQRAPKEEITTHIPQLRPASLDKYIQTASSFEALFFDEALKALFKIELLAKNSSLSALFLWEYLIAQIAQKRMYYAKKTTSRSLAQRH